jgi:hypothetical protein
MWGNKKPETPPLADPGPKIVEANQSLKPAPASWGGNNQDEQGCDASNGSGSGPRDSPARIEPACERQNLRRRGSSH